MLFCHSFFVYFLEIKIIVKKPRRNTIILKHIEIEASRSLSKTVSLFVYLNMKGLWSHISICHFTSAPFLQGKLQTDTKLLAPNCYYYYFLLPKDILSYKIILHFCLAAWSYHTFCWNMATNWKYIQLFTQCNTTY